MTEIAAALNGRPRNAALLLLALASAAGGAVSVSAQVGEPELRPVQSLQPKPRAAPGRPVEIDNPGDDPLRGLATERLFSAEGAVAPNGRRPAARRAEPIAAGRDARTFGKRVDGSNALSGQAPPASASINPSRRIASRLSTRLETRLDRDRDDATRGISGDTLSDRTHDVR